MAASAADYTDHIKGLLTQRGTPLKSGNVIYEPGGGGGSELNCILTIQVKDHRDDLLYLELGIVPELNLASANYKIFSESDASVGDNVTNFIVTPDSTHIETVLSRGAIKDKKNHIWTWRARPKDIRDVIAGIASGNWRYQYVSKTRGQKIIVDVMPALSTSDRNNLLRCIDHPDEYEKDIRKKF